MLSYEHSMGAHLRCFQIASPELIQSIDNFPMLLILLKKPIFITNCNGCYFNFILALYSLGFTIQFYLLLIII